MARRDDEELEIRRRLDVCFNQPVDRDCEGCLAHGDYDGPCCFSKRFEADDSEDCQECRHFYDCGEESGYEFDDEGVDIRIGPKGDRIPPLGPPIRTSIWDRLRDGRARPVSPAALAPSKFTVQPRTKTGAIPANAPRARTTTITPNVQKERYISMDDRIPIGDENPDETAAGRFVKDSVWGGGEGFFRAAYDFFRTRRLR